jgi:hypothetical protein
MTRNNALQSTTSMSAYGRKQPLTTATLSDELNHDSWKICVSILRAELGKSQDSVQALRWMETNLTVFPLSFAQSGDRTYFA